MKNLITLYCLALPFLSFSQAMGDYPCANKAISLEDVNMQEISRPEVEDFMCDCPIFALGADLIVYVDVVNGTRITTIFSFQKNKCIGVLWRVDHKDENVVDELTSRMNDLYQEHQLLVERSSPYPIMMWWGLNTYVQMTHGEQLVELKKTYAK